MSGMLYMLTVLTIIDKVQVENHEFEREREREFVFDAETKVMSICQKDFSCASRIKFYVWTPGGEIETIHTWNVYLPVEKMYQAKIIDRALTT